MCVYVSKTSVNRVRVSKCRDICVFDYCKSKLSEEERGKKGSLKSVLEHYGIWRQLRVRPCCDFNRGFRALKKVHTISFCLGAPVTKCS